MMYILVILLGMDDKLIPFESASHLCQVKIWIATLTFTLVYGTILSKLSRIFFILQHAKNGTLTKSQKVNYMCEYNVNNLYRLTCGTYMYMLHTYLYLTFHIYRWYERPICLC